MKESVLVKTTYYHPYFKAYGKNMDFVFNFAA